jgi:hypothetical protein
MTNREVVRAQQRLDHLFGQTRLVSDDIEIQSHWARYLCVVVSGFLESSVRSLYASYGRRRSSPQIAKFVDSQLKFFQNPKTEKILELAHSFDAAWEAELRLAAEGEPKDAIDSIVANRNNIAHGESVGITFARIRRYYESSLPLLELIDQQCAR